MAYTPLRISTVKPKRELTFDLYIFFKENYLLYVNRGEQLDQPKHKKLKQQKIVKFYVKEEDEPNYQIFLDGLIEEALNSTTMPVAEKVSLASGAAEIAMEKLQKDPASVEAYNLTESAACNLRKIVSKNPEALKKILGTSALEGKNELIIKHSLNVCALATKLAELEGCSETDLNNLATAALMHDIGVTMLPQEHQGIFEKSKESFNESDVRNYNDHCRNSIKVLSEKPFINKDVLNLVANHEETRSGRGPNKKTKLSLMEEIISLVNRYDKNIILSGDHPKSIIKNMMIDELGNYDLDLITNFQKVLRNEGLLDD